MNRRHWIIGALSTLGAGLLAACDKVGLNPGVRQRLLVAEKWSQRAHRVFRGNALAPEFKESDISRDFKANGTIQPIDLDYMIMQDAGFADWRLKVDGLVEQPLSLTLADVRGLPSRTQITRHDCVEGWSSIGKWKGARLSAVLDMARLKPEAKYVVFHCMDTLYDIPYYESVDLTDARHEQTILAYDMNDAPVPVKYGAPLRLRVERMLGYKHAKYIDRIEAVASLEGIGKGKGGYWPDEGYEWYAGI